MSTLSHGSYDIAEAAREQRSIRDENIARAKALSVLTSAERDRARQQELRRLPLDLVFDVRADYERAAKLASDTRSRSSAPRVVHGRSSRAPRRARRVASSDDADADPASGLASIVEVFRILNQWHEERTQ